MRSCKPLYLAALLALSAVGAQAAPVIDLGVAANYSAFIFGNVAAANDVEGKMAVGGNLNAQSLSLGYRVPYTSGGPALVVGGSVDIGNGRIYSTAPASVTNTAAGQGNQPPWDPGLLNYGNSYGVFGSSDAGSASYLDLRKEPKISNYVDFGAAKTQLSSLSQTLSGQASTGQVQQPWSDISLVGSGKAGAVEIFDIMLGSKNKQGNSWVLPSLDLSNVAPDAWVIVNILNAGDVQLTGAFNGFNTIQENQGKVLFNLNNASSVKMGWVEGSVLAPNADLYGSGHVEGTVVGNSISQAFEIGWQPFTPTPQQSNGNKVPEPQSLMLVLGALAAAAAVARRQRRT